MHRKYITLLLMLCGLTVSAQNTTFKYQDMIKMVEKLNLQPDTLKPGVTIIPVDNHRVSIRKAEDGMIEHMGIKIVPTAYRELKNLPVFDFIETATLINAYSLTDNKLRYSQIKFARGNWNTLSTLSDSLDFTVNTADDTANQLIWSKNGTKIVDVTVPIKYDLYENALRKEIENNFVRDIQRYKTKIVSDKVDVANLEPYLDGKDTIYMSIGKTFMQPSISTSTFFRLNSDEEYEPLIDKKFPAQSVANYVVLQGKRIPDAKVIIKVIKSDKKHETVEVTMRQLIGFARQNGCTAYFGIEQINKDKLEGAIFLYNRDAGYNHVLSLTCDVNAIGTPNLVFNSRAYIYAPTNNVKNMYADLKKFK